MSLTRNPALDTFLRALWQEPPAPMVDVFDPWLQCAPDDVDGSGPARRRACLASFLDAPVVDLVLVGEAPGFRGCRMSGVPFASEALVLNNAIPRVAPLDPRFSTKSTPWAEGSATIMWQALYALGLAETTVLWNAFPWHPTPAGNPFGNRTPIARIDPMARAQTLLELLLASYPQAAVVAVGQVAGAMLVDAGVTTAAVLRHPANGGATTFREGLAGVAATLRTSERQVAQA